MSGNQGETRAVDVDAAFLRSRRGGVKVAELVTLFVASVCFAVGSVPAYIVATVFEFFITLFLLLLHLFRLNKKLTLFFWPLVDMFNSTFAAVYLFIVSLVVLTTYSATSILVGGSLCLMSAALHCVEGVTLFKNITFNKPRNERQNIGNH